MKRSSTGNNPSLSGRENLEALAAEIQEGISRNGMHTLDEKGLQALWDHAHLRGEERELVLKNFAQHFDFTVQTSDMMKTATFR